MSRCLVPLLAAACLALPGLARAASAAPDWSRVAGVDTIQVVTHDPDGAERVTTCWLAVHDAQGYIRTGNTRWGANLDRNPDLVAKIAGSDYELRAERIPEGPLYDAVTGVFRDKYGWSDWLIGLFRGIGGAPRIMHLVARPAAPGP